MIRPINAMIQILPSPAHPNRTTYTYDRSPRKIFESTPYRPKSNPEIIFNCSVFVYRSPHPHMYSDESLAPATEGPKFTQPQDMVISKSTRHLLFSELPNYRPHNASSGSGYDVDVIPEVQDLTGRTTSESTDRATACDPNPCQNGGECEHLRNAGGDGFQCHCVGSYGGAVCSDPEEIRGTFFFPGV